MVDRAPHLDAHFAKNVFAPAIACVFAVARDFAAVSVSHCVMAWRSRVVGRVYIFLSHPRTDRVHLRSMRTANASTGNYASPAEYDDFGRRVVPNEYADVAIPPATPAYASPTSSDANSGSPATQPLPSATYSSVDEGLSGRGPQYGQPITAPHAYETPIAVGEEDGGGTAGGYDTPRSLVEAPSGGYAMPAQLSPGACCGPTGTACSRRTVDNRLPPADLSDVPDPSATTA